MQIDTASGLCYPLLAACCAVLAAPAPAQTCSDLSYDSTTAAVGSGPWSALSEDLDGDGRADLVLGYRYSKTVRVLLNQGGGSFGSAKAYPLTISSESIAAGDLDSDGDVDLVAAGYGATPAEDGLTVLLNSGQGQLVAQPRLGLGELGSSPDGMRLGDLDGDQDLDLLVLIDYAGGVLTYLNDGSGGFTSTGTLFPTTYGAVALAVADFDGDQQLDCAAMSGTVGMQISIGWGRGDGTFDPAATLLGGSVYGGGLEVGDFDGDGAPDLVSGHKYGVSLHTYQGNRSFSSSATTLSYYNKGLATGDLDGNGTLDLVATFGGSASVVFLSNNGSGGFSQIAAYPSGVQAYALALDDWNGDGLADAISADYDGALARIWTASCGAGTYCAAKTNSLGCVPAISVSGPPFVVSAANVLNNQLGLLFYGHGVTGLPFSGGTLCVAPPLVRTPALSSGGNPPPGDCSGSYTFDLDAWVRSGVDPSLVPGAQVFAQFWSRDPQDAFGSGLTDAARITLP